MGSGEAKFLLKISSLHTNFLQKEANCPISLSVKVLPAPYSLLNVDPDNSKLMIYSISHFHDQIILMGFLKESFRFHVT